MKDIVIRCKSNDRYATISIGELSFVDALRISINYQGYSKNHKLVRRSVTVCPDKVQALCIAEAIRAYASELDLAPSRKALKELASKFQKEIDSENHS